MELQWIGCLFTSILIIHLRFHSNECKCLIVGLLRIISGWAYQLLAGPSFIIVFTTVGIIFGFAADKYNRVKMLSVCTLVFAVAIVLQGSVQTYWQLVLLRMLMAAGESGVNPLAMGIMSDVFPEEKRALVMAIFNWGIYGGYGIAFPVGRYITQLNIWDLVSFIKPENIQNATKGDSFSMIFISSYFL